MWRWNYSDEPSIVYTHIGPFWRPHFVLVRNSNRQVPIASMGGEVACCMKKVERLPLIIRQSVITRHEFKEESFVIIENKK